jgi:FAD/FMN-containing dehydrogenase
MRGVEVDPQERVAKIEGGATAIDLITTVAPHELAAVTGTVGAVGMVGMTLGGGYGPLTSRHGLALDNLLEAKVVLADGQVIVANGLENAELFWVLRGGGGNFGVVVSMSVRLHPIGKLLAGLILFPWSEAESVLRGYAEKVASAPDELAAPFTVIALHRFHGAATRVPLDATAFGLRREHFLVEIIAAWEPGDNIAIHRQWAQNLSRALAPAALPGGYPNLLGPEEVDRVALAYGDNIGRLQQVKRRFDPEWIFSATPLPYEVAPELHREGQK